MVTVPIRQLANVTNVEDRNIARISWCDLTNTIRQA